MQNIDTALVKALIADQFPRWAHLPVRPVARSGHDNRTFHLGDAMSVRLPSAEGYVPQVQKEQTWLPRLRPLLPLPIPEPLAQGKPGAGYPWAWSVCRWIDGENPTAGNLADPCRFAADLAGFLRALQAVDGADGPLAGAHNYYRGGPLTVYDGETRRAIANTHEALGMDARLLTEMWERGLRSRWTAAPVWVHGDVAVGNLLVEDGHLSGVIDFGCMGVGDPACDVVMAWTFFGEDARDVFLRALSLGEDVRDRARAWALWKALITFDGARTADRAAAAEAQRILREILREYTSLSQF